MVRIAGIQPSPTKRDHRKRNHTWSQRNEWRGTLQPIPWRTPSTCYRCGLCDFLSSTLLDPGGHFKLAHRDHLDTPGLVVIGDGLGTQKTSLSLVNVFVSSGGSR